MFANLTNKKTKEKKKLYMSLISIRINITD